MVSDVRLPVASAAVTYAAFAVPISMLGVVWPDVRSEFDQSLGTLGIVSMIYGIARMSSATSGRPLVARLGTGWSFIVALGVLGAACAVLASASSWPMFLVAVAGIGMMSGLLDSIGAVFIATLGHAGSAGVIHGFYGFGATVGPIVVAVLPGWRWPIIAAVIGVSCALVVAAAVRDRWPEVVTPGDGERSVDDHPSAIPTRLIVVSLLLFATFVAVEVTTGQWIYTYLTDSRDLADGPAALAVSAFWGGLMIGRFLMAGSAAARVIERAGLASLAGTAAVGIVAVAFVPSAIVVIPIALAGLSLAPIIPTMFATTAARVGVRRSASIAGWQLVATNIGAISVPALTGLLVDLSGPGVVLAVVTVILGALGVPLLLGLDRLTARPTIGVR